jgi:hypothetical protein
MPELVVEEALPNPLDGRVSLVLHAAEVVIHFSRLVQQPLLEPRLGGVDDRLVLSDVLLLDRGDLGIQLPGDGVGERRADVHVVVVGLVLPGHERAGMELRDQRRLPPVRRGPEVVAGMPMLDRRRSARQDVRITLQERVGVLPSTRSISAE